MKKLSIFFIIIMHQSSYASYTPNSIPNIPRTHIPPRIIRSCHLCYTAEHYRKELGNNYMYEAQYVKPLKKVTPDFQKKQSRARSACPRTYPDLSTTLIIRSLSRDLYYPPHISSFEILPKR